MPVLASLLVACCPQVANEDALVVAPAPAANDGFGSAVAVDGERLVTGATGHDGAVNGGGAAFVHERDANGSWVHVATLFATAPKGGDLFGCAVDVASDRIVVGARSRDTGAVNGGSVFVFERDLSGNWLLVQEVIAPDATFGDEFGFDVALSGDRLLVGAAFDDDLGTNSGSAYVFEASGGAPYTFVAKLLSPHGAAFDLAGWSVDIDGDRCVVGAQYDDSLATDAGTALVFEFDGVASWNHSVSLYGTGTTFGDRFGFDVAVCGERVLVGAIGDDDLGAEAGAAHVFARQLSGFWNEENKLVAPSTSADDNYGLRVALRGDRAAVGAHLDDSVAFAGGIVELFARRSDGTWLHELALQHSTGQVGEQAGSALALGADVIAIGAPARDVSGNVDAGSVHVVENDVLFHGRPKISIAAPLLQNLHLRAGDAWAGAVWFFGGSASGTSPGIPLGAQIVPLVYDAYTDLTLALAAPLTAPVGVLDADGQGFCRFVLPSGLSPSFAGVVLHHAFVAVHPSTFAVLVSNAVRVELVP